MADLNKVFLMGRLTFDPELRRRDGSAVTDLGWRSTDAGPARTARREKKSLSST